MTPADIDSAAERAHTEAIRDHAARLIDGSEAYPFDRDDYCAVIELCDDHDAALDLIETLKAQRDRLARILTVERGDESAAPEGWERNGDGWTKWGGLLGPHIHVRRERYQPDVWSWSSQSRASGPSRPLRWDGPAMRVGSALEAMEAADAAQDAP